MKPIKKNKTMNDTIKQNAMTDLEFYKSALNYQSFIANVVAEIETYHWDNAFKLEHIKDVFKKYINDEGVKKLFNIENLTIERAKVLRFQRWDEDMPDLWLFPLWFIPFVPYGTKVISISGEERIFTKDTDLDTRFGCVAFGINLKK